MQGREPLERAVLEVLWDAGGEMTAADVANRLPGRARAATTVLTALDRLRRKALVTRTDGGRPHRWRAAGSRESSAADAMLDVLRDSADRRLVLSRFVSEADAEDVDALREMLQVRSTQAREVAAP